MYTRFFVQQPNNKEHKMLFKNKWNLAVYLKKMEETTDYFKSTKTKSVVFIPMSVNFEYFFFIRLRWKVTNKQNKIPHGSHTLHPKYPELESTF